MLAQQRHHRRHMAAIVEVVGDAVEARRRDAPDLLGEGQLALLGAESFHAPEGLEDEQLLHGSGRHRFGHEQRFQLD